MTITSLRNDKSRRVLELGHDDGATAEISHQALRSGCRCSGCTAVRRAGGAVDVDAAIALEQITPVGVYGVQLTFSDGHDRGIYPWQLLLELSEIQAA
ncbi:DUF971 domain-containing protein [Pseudoduganella ginsengisoli]|uniref:DUF971 domain-containing protein n=1 Tax=Pseudoduganella ginsengisoli TaxID=1462440 RepID=A0A6L6Q4J8_9BURK|nr:DUF971 domain-containing protein [Pseudoduganella ginsengisoli]MTW04349.1 DUF971 domain-containing protein [Pseudoduganella ginsengisoli]